MARSCRGASASRSPFACKALDFSVLARWRMCLPPASLRSGKRPGRNAFPSLRSIGGVYDEVEWDTIEYCVMLSFARGRLSISAHSIFVRLFGGSRRLGQLYRDRAAFGRTRARALMADLSALSLSERDAHFLRRSFEVARRAMTHGNHPFGAILVGNNGEVLIEAENGYMP